MLDSATSNKMRNTGIVAAIMVVTIHAQTHNCCCGFEKWWSALVVDGLCRAAVPYFFMASGYLLARRYGEEGWYSTALASRVRSLLVPFLIWNLLAVAMTFGVEGIDGRSLTRVVGDILGIYPFSWPVHGPLWYVRSLLLYIIAAPLLLGALSRHAGTLVIVAFMYFGSLLAPRFLGTNVSAFINQFICVSGLFYFSLGALIALRRRPIPASGMKGGICFLLAALAVFAVCGIAPGFASQSTWHIVRKAGALLVVAGIWSIVPATKWPSWLTGLAFPLYCIHVFPIFVFHHLGPLGCVGSPVSSILALTVSVVIHVAICSILPKCVMRTIYGGRNA